MLFFSNDLIAPWVQAYGAGMVGILTTAEYTGLPVPAEAALVVAAVYAGTTGQLNIVEVVAAAAGGAVLGQLFGYMIGRTVGMKVLRRWGPKIGMTDDRLMVGRYLFRHHGAKVIVLGHFVAFLRTLGALLAGANGMPLPRFVISTICGGCFWASLYGFGAYQLGYQMESFAHWLALLLLVLAVLAVLAARRSERRLTALARREEQNAQAI